MATQSLRNLVKEACAAANADTQKKLLDVVCDWAPFNVLRIMFELGLRLSVIQATAGGPFISPPRFMTEQIFQCLEMEDCVLLEQVTFRADANQYSCVLQVSRCWNVRARIAPGLFKLRLYRDSVDGLDHFLSVRNLASVRTVNCWSDAVDADRLIGILRRCPNVETLSLTRCDLLSDDVFSRLPELRRLQRLGIHNCPPIASFDWLSALPSLRNLFLPALGRAQAHHLQSLPNLVQLDLRGELSDMECQPISALTSLESLRLEDTVSSFQFLAPLTHLRRLAIGQKPGSAALPLPPLPELRRASLVTRPGTATVASLSQSPHLINLHLRGSVDGAVVEALLQSCPNLTRLFVDEVDGDCFEPSCIPLLSGLPSLTRLRLEVDLDGAGLGCLAGLRNLQSLSISLRRFDRSSLKCLSTLRNLSLLRIRSRQRIAVAKEWFDWLPLLPKLTHAALNFVVLTASDRQWLQALIPGCKVKWFWL